MSPKANAGNASTKRVSQNSTISRSDMNYRGGAHTSGNMNRSNNPIIGGGGVGGANTAG